MSRLTPTIPVIAPPYGSSAEGELWVSTLWVIRKFSSKTIPPELSENTETQKSFLPFFFLISFVAPLIKVLYRPSLISSIGLAKIVCLQCSDQVWAIDSSSMSVGLRPRPSK